MTITDPGDPLLPSHREGRHRSARERQRKGPMWGCLKGLVWVFAIALIVLLIGVGGGWWYLGSTSFADLVKKRIEDTLESKLGREVHIGKVTIIKTRPQRVIIDDLTIANAPGGVAEHFATVKQIEIAGGVESFWGRAVKVDRVDIREPRLWFEVFPDGNHNFPKWKSGPKSPREIVRLDIGKLFIANGGFGFLDRKHDIEAVATNIDSQVSVTRAQGLYEGIMTSPLMRVRLQEYETFDVDLRGGFRYTPGILELRSIAMKGRGIEAFVSGKLDPLTEAVYDLGLTSRLTLERIREIFGVENTLAGTIALDTRLTGKAGNFRLKGGWASPKITADTYTLDDAKGSLDINGSNMVVDVEKASYGGGTIGAHYTLAQYAEPYPMKVDLRYAAISIEQLFSDWGVEGTGLRGAATGKLTYGWNKDKVLEGAGTGTAKLAKNTLAFSDARYPIPLAGATDFSLDKGVVTFRNAALDTDASHIDLNGSLKIEGVVTDLQMTIRSTDFSELDRVAYNFAHSAGKEDFELLGLGGSGTITGTVRGPIDTPQVAATVTGNAIRYNEVLLGDGELAIRYDGNKSVLTFERAVFADAGGRLALTGTVAFPDSGPGPRFDIAVEASGYPTQRAIDAVGLDLKIGEGLATGKMIVTGTPENGRATFAGLNIRRGDASLALNGSINWLPGEGNVAFDLDIAATNFPVADIASFLDFANLPITGALTGTLKLAGRKEALEGQGSVTVRDGTVMGEPIELASADLVFTQGRMRATNVIVRSTAGEIRGEGEVDLTNERFSYTISSSSIDLSRLKLLESIRDLLGGTVVLESTGAGTFEQPELVVNARLEGATLRGLTLPAGSEPPSLYIAIRDGRLIVRGAIADIVTIEGDGVVGENMSIDGNVRVSINDIARAAALSPATATIPASGKLVLDLKLSGRLSPIEALVIEATAPVFDLKIAEQEFTAPEPIRITLRNGRIEFDSFVLQRTDSVFAVTGFAEITGAKRLDVDVRGVVQAALLQLFMADVRADGTANVEMSIDGTMTDPRMLGTAELRDAEIKFAGFPQLIDELNGTVRFRGDRIEIESVRATIGGGTVVAGGSIMMNGMQPQSARITLQGTDVSIRYYEGVTIEGNFNLLLSGDLANDTSRALLQGDVDVTRGLYYKDFDIQQTLLNALLARNRVIPVSAATWQDRIGLRIHLSAPDTLAVQNNIAEVTGSAELDVTGTLANPVVIGEVTLDEGGRVRIQGVDYRVTRGTVAFQNPFRIDPFFDVTIEGTVSGFGASETEGGPYEVTLNVTGTLDRITPTITSDPPASDITLFSILGLGGLGGQATAGGVGLLSQSLLYQSLGSLIGSRVFPFVDSFSYDPGGIDTGSGPGAKVTFEKRLSNKVRFLLVYNLENQQSRQVVEWLVNPSWTLQLTRDETDEYRLDARFRRRYEAHWELGDREDDFATAATTTGGGTTETAVRTPAPPVTTVNPHAADDAPIAQINFRADAGFDTNAIANEVTLKPGQTVSVRELQSSIKNLFATGNFRDIRVDAARTTEGVVLTFSLYLHYRVGEIEIVGLLRNDRMRAQRELSVRLGEILSLNDVEESAAAIEDMLHQIGYLEATVDPETNFFRERNVAEVTFQATPGPKATVGDVIVEGNTAPFTREELIDRMGRKPGETFSLPEAREDAKRIQNFLVRRNYRRADVDFLGHTYDEATHLVQLRYRVQVGPTVKVEVSGVSRGTVRRWLPFGRNQEYSEDTVDRAADDIVEGLQLRGYYLATVDYETELENDVLTVTFVVNPGRQYRLTDVSFIGNDKVDDDDLKAIVATSPSGGFRRALQSLLRRPTGVTRGQLGDDRDAIESFYRLAGFSEATVGEPGVTTREDGSLSVTFPVTEGPQTLVTDVTVEGNEEIAIGDLPKPQLAQGQPLNPQLLHEDVVALQTYYANRGHVEVEVAPRVTVSTDKTQASVVYTIAEGPHVEVDEVIVRGNTYTDRDVVLRKSDIRPGQPFSYTALLEAQRELYRLGIFQRVEVQSTQTGTAVGDRDVTIQVEEGRNLTLSGSVGLRVEREGVGEGAALHERVAVAAAHRNLFGTGRYLGLEIVAGREEKEAFLTYREPFIGRWNVPLQFQIFQTDDSTRQGTQIEQTGLSIEASKVARLQTRWSARYEYLNATCEGDELCDRLRDNEPIESLDPELLAIQISSITPTFFWDTRDDILDPHRGFFTSASIEYAFPLFAAEEEFLKEYVSAAYYLPFTTRTTLAVSGRVGLIQAYARNPIKPDENGLLMGGGLRPIPLSERFTAGGETSHRAFPLNLLGDLCRREEPPHEELPEDECRKTLYAEFDAQGNRTSSILPLGGSSMALMNVEYRFPIFGRTVGGAVFADIGNVFAGQQIEFDNLRYGAGFGVRYLSPVGPLRIDVATPLRRRFYEDRWQFFFTLGYAF